MAHAELHAEVERSRVQGPVIILLQWVAGATAWEVLRHQPRAHYRIVLVRIIIFFSCILTIQ